MKDTIEFTFSFKDKETISVTRSGLLKSQQRMIAFLQDTINEWGSDTSQDEYLQTYIQLECAKHVFKILLNQKGDNLC